MSKACYASSSLCDLSCTIPGTTMLHTCSHLLFWRIRTQQYYKQHMVGGDPAPDFAVGPQGFNFCMPGATKQKYLVIDMTYQEICPKIRSIVYFACFQRSHPMVLCTYCPPRIISSLVQYKNGLGLLSLGQRFQSYLLNIKARAWIYASCDSAILRVL